MPPSLSSGLSRRHLFTQLGAAGLLAACSPAAKPETGGVLRAGILTTPWPDRIVRAFAKEPLATGLKWSAVTGNAVDQLAKLIAARGQQPPFDVVELDDLTYGDLKAADLIEPFTAAEIPSLSQLNSTAYDNYRVPYWSTQPALLYNPAKLAAAGIPAPKTYKDLLDPRLAKRVWYPDLGMYTNFYAILGLAHDFGGDEANPKPGFDAFAKVQPFAIGGSPTVLNQAFANGDVWVIVAPSSVAVRIREAGIKDIAVSYPPTAGHPVALAYGYLGIVKGTPRRKEALQFINAIVSPIVQDSLYGESGVMPVNQISLQHAHDGLLKYPARVDFLQLDPKVVARSWVPHLGEVDKRAYGQLWQQALDVQPR